MMERALLERMIGAGILLVALVVVVPAILDGNPETAVTSPSDNAEREVTNSAAPARTHIIRLDSRPDSPPVARQAAPANQVAEAQPVSEPAPPPAPAIAAVVAAPTQAKPSTPSAVPAKKASVAPAPKPQVKSARPGAGWVVQLGSFSQRANARRLADDTRAKGFPSFLLPLERSGNTMYRVRVGPRKTRADAVQLAGQLAKGGYKGQVVEQTPSN